MLHSDITDNDLTYFDTQKLNTNIPTTIYFGIVRHLVINLKKGYSTFKNFRAFVRKPSF
jgi:hypothetical protein